MDPVQNFLDATPNLRVRNVDEFKRKVRAIAGGGSSALQVIVDFDNTLTRFRLADGRRGFASHGIIMKSGLFSKEFENQIDELYRKYYPIEIDTTCPPEKKAAAMIEWWNLAHDQFISTQMTRHQVAQIVTETRDLEFRDGVAPFFSTLADHEVPLMIFSAGLGDIIVELVTQKLNTPLHKNLHIVSNFMSFDGEGPEARISGFKEPMIHVLNKNESVVAECDYVTELRTRRNVVLVGDSLHDLHMSEGIDHDECLRVGILNDKIEQLEAEYTQRFDIVIVDPGTFQPVVDLLNIIQK